MANPNEGQLPRYPRPGVPLLRTTRGRFKTARGRPTGSESVIGPNGLPKAPRFDDREFRPGRWLKRRGRTVRPPDRPQPGSTRREFLINSAVIGAGLATYGASELVEYLDYPASSRLAFDPEDQKRLEKEQPKRVVIVIPGAGFQKSDDLRKVLKESLGEIGLVASMENANDDLDPISTAKEINGLKQKGVKEVVIVPISSGVQTAGDVMYLVDPDIKMTHAALISPATSFATMRIPQIAYAVAMLKAMGYDGDGILALYANRRVHKAYIRPGASSGTLWFDQLKELFNGEESLLKFVIRAVYDDADLAIVTSADPSQEDVINPGRSLPRIKGLVGKDVPVFTMNAGHAAILDKPDAINEAMRKVIESWNLEKK